MIEPTSTLSIQEVEEDEGALVLEPRDVFDAALIGFARQGGTVMAVYSEAKVIEALIADGMTEEDALDHYGFNVSGSIGVGLPVFMLEANEDD
jgi:hypothetical protein